MRILFVTPYYKPAYIYGGPARSIPVLCESLAQLGVQVTVYTTNANGQNILAVPTSRAIPINDVQVYYFPISPLLPRRYFYSQALGVACRKSAKLFDVIYVCGSWVYQVVAAATPSIKAGVPYIISPRGSFMEWSFRKKQFKKRLYLDLVERHFLNQAAAIHCTSQMEADQTKTFGFRPPIFVIPNAVFSMAQTENQVRGMLRYRLGITEEEPVTLYIGRFHQMKRVDRMIEVFIEVLRGVPNAHLVMVGEDEDGSGIQAQKTVRQNNLEHNVHFTGLLKDTDLLQAYIDSDLLVLFSHRENFGMVVVEALSMGVPVLLSDKVGVANEVVKGNAGMMVDVDSEGAITEWIRLLNSPAERKAMAQAGLYLAKTVYSPESVSKAMLQLFERVISS